MQSLWVSSQMEVSPNLQVLLSDIVDNLQASLSVGTWSNYNTAMNNLKRCSEYVGIPMELPLNEIQAILYMAYLLKIRGILPETVASYFSGLRMAHLAKGFPVPTLRSALVNQVLKGATNLRNIRQEEQGRPHRRAMTIPLLLLLQQRIDQSEWPDFKKVLVWCISVVAFFGAFRLGTVILLSFSDWPSPIRLSVKDKKINLIIFFSTTKSNLKNLKESTE